MKRIIITLALVIATSVTVFGQTSDKQSDTDERGKAVVALANEYAKALVNRDVATMERILAPEYVSIAPEDIPYTKHLVLRLFKELPANAPRLEALEVDPTVVRVYDNTVVVLANIYLTWHGSKKEAAKAKQKIVPRGDANYIVTLVAVKKDAQWQIVSTHVSKGVKVGITK